MPLRLVEGKSPAFRARASFSIEASWNLVCNPSTLLPCNLSAVIQRVWMRGEDAALLPCNTVQLSKAIGLQLIDGSDVELSPLGCSVRRLLALTAPLSAWES